MAILMAMKRVSVAEAKNKLPALLHEAETEPVEIVRRGKPVAVVGASTGAFGAVWSQAELRKVLGAIGARVVEGDVAVGHASTRFEGDHLVDTELREQLAEIVRLLVSEAASRVARTVAA